MTILATRIPVMSQDLVELITDLFSDSAKLSRNKVSYILEEVGRSLYQHDWRFEIKKTGKDIITTFDEDEHNKNGDGEHKLLPESPSLN
jgi:phenylpyruvate tautomerase PptA (4-oxalocrotonate tautomerase family)